MSCRNGAGRGATPTARTAAAWAALVAGVVITATGLFPARADAGPGGAATTTGPAARVSSTATTEPSTSSSTTTTTTMAPTSTTDPGNSSTVAPTSSTDLMSSSTLIEPSSTTATRGASTTTTGPLRAGAGGGLRISAPELINLGAKVTGGGEVSARLGTVTVTDTRGVVDGAWTARVSSTGFVTGDGSTGQRVARSAIAYWSGPASARSGAAVLAPGQPDRSQAVRLTTTRTAFSATGVSGDNIASWNPTVVIRVPDAAVAGSYRGAIIHSVA